MRSEKVDKKSRAKLLVTWLAIILFLAACSRLPWGHAKNADATPVPVPFYRPMPTGTVWPIPTPAGLVTSLIDAPKAVIRIRSKGQFLDPPGSSGSRIAGRGSGFIIDPSGIAVTSQRVVSGAEDISVWIGGDQANPVHARVLGISECNDLAVIDIDGEGYPYLPWSALAPVFSLEVTVAGAGFYGPQVDSSPGMIVKTDIVEQNSTTVTASLLEHTARTPAGFSGGPILDANGAILGVNFGRLAPNEPAQGIASQDLRPLVASLASGQILDSLSLNVQALTNDELGLHGVWVSAVQPRSSAQAAGLQAGDVLIGLSNQSLQEDHTLSTYCRIIRESLPGQPVAFEAYRPSTGKSFEGTIGPYEEVILPTPQATSAFGMDGVFNPGAKNPGETYYSYDFTAGLEGLDQSSSSGDLSTVTAQVTGDQLLLEMRSIYSHLFFIYSDQDIADTRLDITAANLGSNNLYISLICRYSDIGWYEFSVSSNGIYRIYRYDPALGNPYILLGEGVSFDVHKGTEANDYSAICQGDQLTFFINGSPVQVVFNEELTGGKTGFSLASQARIPVQAAIDHFSASVP